MKDDAHLSARYFASPAQFRRWLDRHHADAKVLWVGYHKRETGRPSLTWSESVDVALCYGWIDGVRRPVDEERYAIRFTPRSSKSNWSRVNLAKAKELIAAGQMHPAGLAAYQGRDPSKTYRYLYEQKERPGLAPRYLAELRKHPRAWTFYKAQAPWYQRIAGLYVMSAVKEETRQRRLARLIKDCAAGRLITPGGGKK